MGMIAKGMISKLNKQAEEALNPKEGKIADFTAEEARKLKQEALSSKAIPKAAFSFAQKCLSIIKKRAKDGYSCAFVEIKGYDRTPVNKEIINQAMEILREKGYDAHPNKWMIDVISISWKEGE